MDRKLVLIRGGGDIATGIAHRLFKCGYSIVVTEIGNPTVIRRTVSFAQAVFDNLIVVEGVTAVKVRDVEQIKKTLKQKKIVVVVDENASLINRIKPHIVIDSILAKKNLGTDINMAPIVIGVGPGFEARKDVHAVVETNRGHYLGRVIINGDAQRNTGTPANIDGYTYERVVWAKKEGKVRHNVEIGERVDAGQVIAFTDDYEVKTKIGGVLRGLIQSGIYVNEGTKIADVDPRAERDYCFTISDKARAIAGGVIEAILCLEAMQNENLVARD
ncbi:MAG: EF2563 family selenium-dependent molybdenum hydroxylase system protein [Clostridiales bacterium]|nr:EF2563 family selenium-dependent molybdenum hydroxylase system protein [Clostridiales bacterium]